MQGKAKVTMPFMTNQALSKPVALTQTCNIIIIDHVLLLY